MSGSFTSFVPSVEEDEQQVLSYILKNPKEHFIINKQDFVNAYNREIYNAITDCYLNLDITSFDRRVIQKNCPSIPLDHINLILDKKNHDFNFIKSCIKNIRDYKVKLHIGDTVEQFLVHTTSKGELNYDTIRDLADAILYNSIKLDDDKTVLSFEDLANRYRKTLEKREDGLNKRTYGFQVIDKMLMRPAAAGEMTTVVGMKGSGKSLLVKCMENILVNKGICVISVNLEMVEESTMDRLVSIETNLSLEDLLSDNKSEEVKQIIEDNLKQKEKNKNYAYYSEPIMSLTDLDTFIYKCKQKFKEAGVLPEDGYCILTTDLTEQIEELSGKAGTDLKPGVNKLLQLTKKHNIHTINILQSNENIFRNNKTFSNPESCDNFTIQPEMIEGGSVYAARSRIVLAINRPLTLKRRYFPEREDEWNISNDIIWVNVVKQNDSQYLGRTPMIFGGSSFRLFPYKNESTN